MSPPSPVHDATTRFSSRVADYVRYRPSYPDAVVAHLRTQTGLAPSWTIADIGAGTGISAKLFLDAGCQVLGVEPNADMRQAMETLLAPYPRFRPVAGTAEATTLPPASVDLICCAQAFHWFDVPKARREFCRILKPAGWVALLWNDRDRRSPLLAEYDALLVRYCDDYGKVRHDRVPEERVRDFFAPAACQESEFPNQQDFDFPGLKGRLLSSSYAPLPGHPNHAPMLAALQDLFDRHQTAGRVTFPYRTRLFFGRPSCEL